VFNGTFNNISGTDFIDAPLKIGQEGQLALVKCAFTYKYPLAYANIMV
jgi:hypothetical protein